MCIYCSTLAVLGFEVVAPTEEEFERLVSPAIALVKASKPDDAAPLLAEAAAKLFGRGAEIIILGCTEIPIGMRRQYKENPELFVDSTEALALAVIDFAKNGAQPTP
jgi:aspartate racemase